MEVIDAEKLRERGRAAARRYYWSHRELCQQRSREYRESNKDKVREYAAAYQSKNRDRRRQQCASYKKANRDKISAYNRSYRLKNQDVLREKKRKKIQENPIARIHRSMSSRLAKCVRLKGKRKSAATMELVGCSIQALRKHLESQFKDGMNWENYGHKGWHVDHIKPCSSFDLSQESEQKACFHWSNLQPLWCHENYAKGAKQGSEA